MANLAWGGFSNGRIPRANMVDIGDGKLLQADAAYNFNRWNVAFRQRWGENLYLASYQDAYRDINKQNWMYTHPVPGVIVAYPGTSNHGWARAVDVSGYGALNSARHIWMQQNGPSYGWSWATGKASNESWHWEYVGPITTTAGDGGVTPFPPEPEPETENEEMSYLFWNIINPGGTGLNGTFWMLRDGFLCLFPSQTVAVAEAARWGKTSPIETIQQGALLPHAEKYYGIPQAVWTPLTTSTEKTWFREASSGQLTQALTSSVVLVNEHADENKDEIIAAIPTGGGAAPAPSAEYDITLTGDVSSVPGTVSLTGTATPQV